MVRGIVLAILVEGNEGGFKVAKCARVAVVAALLLSQAALKAQTNPINPWAWIGTVSGVPAGTFSSWSKDAQELIPRTTMVVCMQAAAPIFKDYKGPSYVKLPALEYYAATCAVRLLPSDYPDRERLKSLALEQYAIAVRTDATLPAPDLP
jgi:hypothetical protein